MGKEAAAQVVADAFAQHTSQIDEDKDGARLEHQNGGVGLGDLDEQPPVGGHDALVDDAFAQKSKIGIQAGDQDHCAEKPEHPERVDKDQTEQASEGLAVERRVELFLFKFDGVSHVRAPFQVRLPDGSGPDRWNGRFRVG